MTVPVSADWAADHPHREAVQHTEAVHHALHRVAIRCEGVGRLAIADQHRPAGLNSRPDGAQHRDRVRHIEDALKGEGQVVVLSKVRVTGIPDLEAHAIVGTGLALVSLLRCGDRVQRRGAAPGSRGRCGA